LKKTDKGPEDPSRALIKTKPCYWTDRFLDTSAYNGALLKHGNILNGPAIVEEPVTTLVIPEGFQCRIDPYGNYKVTRRN